MNCSYCNKNCDCPYSVGYREESFCSAECNLEQKLEDYIERYDSIQEKYGEEIHNLMSFKSNYSIMTCYIVPSQLRRIQPFDRNEILERDDDKCRDCGSDSDELEVHHIYNYPIFFKNPNFSKEIIIGLYKVQSGRIRKDMKIGKWESSEAWTVIKEQANKANHPSNLVTLCKNCHNSVTKISNQPQYFNQTPKYNPWNEFNKNDIIPFIPEKIQNSR